MPPKTLLDHRVEKVERELSDINVLLKSVDTAVTKLTEASIGHTQSQRDSKATFERAFTQIDNMKTAILGDGINLGFIGELRSVKDNLNANTWLTRTIVSAMIGQFLMMVAAAAGMFYLLSQPSVG